MIPKLISAALGIGAIALAVLAKRSRRWYSIPLFVLLLIVGGFFFYRATTDEPFALAATEDVRPNATAAEEAGSCTTSDAHTTMDDDVEGGGDSSLCTASTPTSSHDIRLNFATPSGNPTTGTNAQTFKLLAINSQTSGNGVATAALDFYCNGVLIEAGANQNLGDTLTTITETFTFDAGSCATDGSDVEVLIDCLADNNGGTSNDTSCNYEAVEWVADYFVTPPSVTTNAASSVSFTTLTLNGDITSIGDASVTQHGFAFGTSSSLTGANVATSTLGAGSAGTYTENEISLIPATTYYFRAYATNTGGTGYGSIQSTTTLANVSPTVALNTADATAFGTDTTPTLDFTGTDGDSDDIRYNVQIDTDVDFDGNLQDGNLNSSTGFDSLQGGTGASSEGFQAAGQTIIPISSFSLTSIDLKLSRAGTPTDEIRVSIYTGSETGTLLGTSDSIDISGVTTDSAGEVINFPFSIPVSITSGVTHYIVVERTGARDTSNKMLTLRSIDNSYSDGINRARNNNVWSDNTSFSSGGDLYFQLYGVLSRVSGTDSGFSGSPDNTDPFTSGQQVSFTVQAGDALSTGTYYWRARGIDPSGSNTYGDWATTRSFTVDTGGGGDPPAVLNQQDVIFFD